MPGVPVRNGYFFQRSPRELNRQFRKSDRAQCSVKKRRAVTIRRRVFAMHTSCASFNVHWRRWPRCGYCCWTSIFYVRYSAVLSFEVDLFKLRVVTWERAYHEDAHSALILTIIPGLNFLIYVIFNLVEYFFHINFCNLTMITALQHKRNFTELALKRYERNLEFLMIKNTIERLND